MKYIYIYIYIYIGSSPTQKKNHSSQAIKMKILMSWYLTVCIKGHIPLKTMQMQHTNCIHSDAISPV